MPIIALVLIITVILRSVLYVYLSINKKLGSMKLEKIIKFSYIILLLITIMVGSAKIGLSQIGSSEIIEGDKMYYILPLDGIPAIDDPEFVSVSKAEKFMNDDELVMGLVVNGDARAYSTWHLDKHEIVNDYVGGVHVSVTW